MRRVSVLLLVLVLSWGSLPIPAASVAAQADDAGAKGGADEAALVEPFWEASATETDVTDVERLDQVGGGLRWLFGRDKAFVEERSTRYSRFEAQPGAATGAAGVVGTTYSSPQFGFRVSWEAPWELARPPVSEPGQLDDLQLSAGQIAIEYFGVFSDLDPAAFFQAAIEARRQQVPDLLIEQGYQGPQSGLPAIVTYSMAGVPMADLIHVMTLTPGIRQLLIVESYPIAIPAGVRQQADHAVHLESLGPSSSADGGAGIAGVAAVATIEPHDLLDRLLATPFAASEIPSGAVVSDPHRTQVASDQVFGFASYGAIGEVTIRAKDPAISPNIGIQYGVFETPADAAQAYQVLAPTVRGIGTAPTTVSPFPGFPPGTGPGIIWVHYSALPWNTIMVGSLVQVGNVLVATLTIAAYSQEPPPVVPFTIELTQGSIAHVERLSALSTAPSRGRFGSG